MANYLQTDQNGKVIGVIDDPIIAGLYDGVDGSYREIGEGEARVIEGMLRDPKIGPRLHMDDLVELVPSR
jgi:hypothetical protein